MTYIFAAVLVNSQVDSTKGTPSDLLLDDVLVDPMLGGSVILTRSILRVGIEGFLAVCASAPTVFGMGRRCRPSRDVERSLGGYDADEDCRMTSSTCIDRKIRYSWARSAVTGKMGKTWASAYKTWAREDCTGQHVRMPNRSGRL
jgi:hypothetical protein